MALSADTLRLLAEHLNAADMDGFERRVAKLPAADRHLLTTLGALAVFDPGGSASRYLHGMAPLHVLMWRAQVAGWVASQPIEDGAPAPLVKPSRLRRR